MLRVRLHAAAKMSCCMFRRSQGGGRGCLQSMECGGPGFAELGPRLLRSSAKELRICTCKIGGMLVTGCQFGLESSPVLLSKLICYPYVYALANA